MKERSTVREESVGGVCSWVTLGGGGGGRERPYLYFFTVSGRVKILGPRRRGLTGTPGTLPEETSVPRVLGDHPRKRTEVSTFSLTLLQEPRVGVD